MQSTVLRPGVPSKSAVAVRIARVLCSHALGWGKHTHRNECAFWNVAVELEIGKTIGITTQTYAMVKARKFQLVERVSFVRPVRFSTEQGVDGNGVGSGCVRFQILESVLKCRRWTWDVVPISFAFRNRGSKMSTAILGLGSDRRHQEDGKTTVFVMNHEIS